MFGKSDGTRWNDTIAYLNLKFQTDRLGDHINQQVPTGRRKAISAELGLGSRPDGNDDPKYQANTNARHALRGLLLCHRVYYSGEFWAKQSAPGPGLTVDRADILHANWKMLALQHWGGRSEIDLIAGIAMFVPRPGATRQDLVNCAKAGAPNGVGLPGNPTLSRNDTFTVGAGVTCYVGVQGWLVRSGIVSMRWLMSNCGPNKQKGCDELFGAGREVWNGPIDQADIPRVQQIINGIGAGYVVHIWCPQNSNWNGHWVITNGDGTICGVNNGEVLTRNPPVQKNYTNHSTLLEQFLGYSFELDPVSRKRSTSVMAVIDPMAMPQMI